MSDSPITAAGQRSLQYRRASSTVLGRYYVCTFTISISEIGDKLHAHRLQGCGKGVGDRLCDLECAFISATLYRNDCSPADLVMGSSVMDLPRSLSCKELHYQFQDITWRLSRFRQMYHQEQQALAQLSEESQRTGGSHGGEGTILQPTSYTTRDARA